MKHRHLDAAESNTLGRSLALRAPLLPAALGLVCGIVAADRYTIELPPMWLVMLSTVFALVLACWKRFSAKGGAMGIWLLAFVLGMVLIDSNRERTRNAGILNFMADGGSLVRVSGVIADEPRVLEPRDGPFAAWSFRSQRGAFTLDVRSIEGAAGAIPTDGLVRVSMREPNPDLQRGDGVSVFGWLYGLRGPRNPGSFDWASYQRRRGVVGSMVTDHVENVTRIDLAEGGAAGLATARARIRELARHWLLQDIAGGGAGGGTLLEGLVLGQRSRVDAGLNETFIRAGCVHYLAVSGVHVGILMLWAALAVRVVGGGKHVQTVAMLIAIGLILILAESRPPVLRASVLGIAYCIARLLGRERAGLNWLSLAVVVLLVAQPQMLFDVGFQLSTVAVLGVCYLSGPLERCPSRLRRWLERVVLRDPWRSENRALARKLRWARLPAWRKIWGIRHFSWRSVWSLLSVSLAAWLATLPIIVMQFGRVAMWGSVNSLLMFPLVSASLVLGYAKLIVGAVFPVLGSALGGLLWWSDAGMSALASQLSALPGAMYTMPVPPAWLVMLYYVVLVLVCVGHRQWHGDDVRTDSAGANTSTPVVQVRRLSLLPWRQVALAVTITACVFGALSWWMLDGHRGSLRITALAVGDGSATVIELPNGETVLYDVGSQGPHDVGKNVVLPYLRKRGIRRVDQVHISHANLDHYNGLLSVIDAVPTGPILVNEHFLRGAGERSPVTRLVQELADRGRRLRVVRAHDVASEDSVWSRAGVTAEWLWPTDDCPPWMEPNDTSTVLRLSYGGSSVLLTGDIESPPQARLMSVGATRDTLSSDVLFLPHHGSVTPTLPGFVSAVAPELAVRSSGKRASETTNGLFDILAGTAVASTGDMGAVVIELGSDGVRSWGFREDADRVAPGREARPSLSLLSP